MGTRVVKGVLVLMDVLTFGDVLCRWNDAPWTVLTKIVIERYSLLFIATFLFHCSVVILSNVVKSFFWQISRRNCVNRGMVKNILFFLIIFERMF